MIYNGGIKDWGKSGFAIETIESLPDIEYSVFTTVELHKMLQDHDIRACRDKDSNPLLTILDFRTANHLNPAAFPLQIKTTCPSEKFMLDDILLAETRDSIPRLHQTITITETGNRDEFIIRYLSKYGFTNITSLKYGMRGWLKQRYPTH